MSTLPVWAAENFSVENAAMAPSHASAGAQYQTISPIRFREASGRCWIGAGTTRRSELKRDGHFPKKNEMLLNSSELLQPVVRRFTRDDHVMDVAFAKSCAADANEARFLLQFANG